MTEADSRKPEDAPSTRSLLDVVEEDFPEKVGGLFGGLNKIGRLFTFEDWLKILTRSRSSFESSRTEKK